MFDQLQDTRSASSRFWSFVLSILVNTAVLITIAVVSQVYAVRSTTERMMDSLRRQLANYKMILLLPNLPKPELKEPLVRAKKIVKQPAREPKPLDTPDPRILNRLDPVLAGFIKENPAIEGIITREIVRDLDTKVLDLQKLLKKSSLQVSFEINETGQFIKRRMEKSSKVPSIDHLAMEIISLLEKYRILAPMKGLRRVVASILVEQKVEVRFEGEAPDEIAADEIRKQLQNSVTLGRFALGTSEAAFLLEDVALVTKEKQVHLIRVFEKEPLVDFLMQFYRQEPKQPEPPSSIPNVPLPAATDRFPDP